MRVNFAHATHDNGTGPRDRINDRVYNFFSSFTFAT